MINKIFPSVEAALAGVADGSTIMIGGFGGAGQPAELIDGLIAQGAKDLVIVNNNAGNADYGLAALLKTGRVRKIICSFPRQADSHVFDGLYRAGKIELELVPQGNLAERIRAEQAALEARAGSDGERKNRVHADDRRQVGKAERKVRPQTHGAIKLGVVPERFELSVIAIRCRRLGCHRGRSPE